MFKARPVAREQVDDDDDLLFAMPQTRLVSPGDAKSDFQYVTNCVSSTAELIGAMVDSPADQELTLEDFVTALGNGSAEAGRAILDRVFPDYRRSGMDIANDYHVRYHASSFDGMPCLYVVHSAIEYVFQRQGFLDAPCWSGPGEASLTLEDRGPARR